jgi:hypothetical protein
MGKLSFIGRIKSGISGAKETVGNYTYASGLKGRQDKMIKSYVDNKSSRLSSENRSQAAVIREKETMDKNIKDKLRAKGIYK